ncbi:MAG TPA: dihydrolipoamide acetyltransferase family protein [Gemmataceae bacterium]|nr:dihydrolipoamide acetyltransferase family protein [Pirellulales bacterium]HZZ80154.1 dihydrolipoamide acetyltransferase family protein [Gemmataceae bacterium]
MTYSIIIPHLGATGGDVVIVEWRVHEGQHVKAGETIFVVETDKAVDEVPAFRDGYVRRILAAAGSEKSPGDVVGLLTDTADEATGQPTASAAPPSSATQPAVQQDSTGSLNPARTAVATATIAATPRARRLAAEHGIDLSTVQPAVGKIIQVRDIEALIHSRSENRPNGANSASDTSSRPVSARRRAIAERTQQSKSEIPHFYISVDVDMTALAEKRHALKTERGGLAIPSLNDCVVAAAARALRETPGLNARYAGDKILQFETVDVGVVIGLDESVVVPLVRKADTLSLRDVSKEIRQLRERADAGTLTSADQSGGALTVSNLGMYGVDGFVAVIHPGQSAVLACGAARPRPWIVEGQVTVRTLMTMTLSVDHRLSDGVPAAQFIQRCKNILEQPAQLFEEKI